MKGLFNNTTRISDTYENLPYPKPRMRDFVISHIGKALFVIGVFLMILGLYGETL